MTTALTDQAIRATGFWLSRFSADFHGEIPNRIHNRDIADDGAPQWHPDFARWLTAREVISTPRPDTPTREPRLRTTRALRRLRKTAVREYEVVYRIMVLGERMEDTTQWLNERAQRNHIPLPPGQTVHYRPRDTMAIMISAIDKMRDWY